MECGGNARKTGSVAIDVGKCLEDGRCFPVASAVFLGGEWKVVDVGVGVLVSLDMGECNFHVVLAEKIDAAVG